MIGAFICWMRGHKRAKNIGGELKCPRCLRPSPRKSRAKAAA